MLCWAAAAGWEGRDPAALAQAFGPAALLVGGRGTIAVGACAVLLVARVGGGCWVAPIAGRDPRGPWFRIAAMMAGDEAEMAVAARGRVTDDAAGVTLHSRSPMVTTPTRTDRGLLPWRRTREGTLSAGCDLPSRP